MGIIPKSFVFIGSLHSVMLGIGAGIDTSGLVAGESVIESALDGELVSRFPSGSRGDIAVEDSRQSKRRELTNEDRGALFVPTSALQGCL